MRRMITLRPATIDDAKLLLEWRNDPKTRAGSHSTAEVDLQSHVAWLAKTIQNPARRLFVAMRDGQPVGTVRVDFDGTYHEFSWTVAPALRGQGIAKEMALLLAEQINGPIRAEVKPENFASMRVAEVAGMALTGEIDGVLHFRRSAVGAAVVVTSTTDTKIRAVVP